MIFEINELSELWMKCGKYNKWDENNWIDWNGGRLNTLATTVLIVVEIIVINGIIVITNTITTITKRIN